jgi:hypothetical protein
VVVVVLPGLLAGWVSPPPQAMALAMAVATARTARMVSFFILEILLGDGAFLVGAFFQVNC